MKVTQELIDSFLSQDNEMQYALHRLTGEVLLDAPESITGEPEIDWDDEDAEKNLISIPPFPSSEAFEVMVMFAKEQAPATGNQLMEVLSGRKPFKNFKDKVLMMGLEDSWYSFENSYARKRLTQWIEENNV